MCTVLVLVIAAVALTVQGLPTTAVVPHAVVEQRLRTAIAELPVREESREGYERDKFGSDWTDADDDCRDTRDEVLAAESRVDVGSGCDVTSGQWFSWYDKVTWTVGSDVDVDHMVPLAEGWDSGASLWNHRTRVRYANDLGDRRPLVGVTDNVNQSKGDGDVADWLPAFHRCRYLLHYTAVKVRWSLAVDAAEQQAMVDLADTCANRVLRVRTARVVLR